MKKTETPRAAALAALDKLSAPVGDKPDDAFTVRELAEHWGIERTSAQQRADGYAAQGRMVKLVCRVETRRVNCYRVSEAHLTTP